MGWASRANGIAEAARRGTIKPKVKEPSDAAWRDAQRLKLPPLAVIAARLGWELKRKAPDA